MKWRILQRTKGPVRSGLIVTPFENRERVGHSRLRFSVVPESKPGHPATALGLQLFLHFFLTFGITQSDNSPRRLSDKQFPPRGWKCALPEAIQEESSPPNERPQGLCDERLRFCWKAGFASTDGLGCQALL